MEKKRIEYLDAMRGFTMILVVLGHVVWYGFNYPRINTFDYTFYNIFAYFRMPLFFFVSGFILYKQNFEWSLQTICTFLNKKFKIQIISTLIFFLIFCYVKEKSIVAGIMSIYKYGYWFTITLFEFFVFYILFQLIMTKKVKKDRFWNLFYGIYVIIIILLSTSKVQELFHFNQNIIIASGFTYPIIQYFVFFSLGIFIKKYFQKFIFYIDNSNLITFVLIIFFGGALFLQKTGTNYHYLNLLSVFVMGVTGIIMIFGIFYKHQHGFSHETILGRTLQYIGKRTLDIYYIIFS